MKTKQVEEMIEKSGYSFKVFGYRKNKKPNQFRITQSFFYRHGQSETNLENKVCKILTNKGYNFEVIDRGENWHSFVGGSKSGSPQDSFWYVIVEINEKELVQ